MRIAILALVAFAVCAQAPIPGTPEMRVVTSAAEALGGRDRILAIKSLTMFGYGQQAYQNGGGNITASPDAPQKWVNVNGLRRTIDFEHDRMRLQQQVFQDFVFAYARNMTGQRVDQVLAGDAAYNFDPQGRAVRVGPAAARARRLEMLNNPISIVRAALDPAAKLGNLRKVGKFQLLDVTTAKGEALALAVDAETNLPAWVSWVEANGNLGDVISRTMFVGYQVESGLRLPYGYSTIIDFRNVVQNKLYVDKYVVDGPVDDIKLGEAGSGGLPPAPAINVQVIPVAKGVWYLKGQGNSTVFEFADHLTLFEAYGSEANAKAIIEKARTLVPGKPVTEVIVSHHHFDHSGGLRAAVAEGLTVITQRGNAELFTEMTSRPAKAFPDALGSNPKPIKITPVDDKLVLKDSAMEVHVYRVMSNSHMADAVLAYVPRERLVAEGDLVDEGWDIVWWGNTYPDTVKYWKLDVERDLPVHGNIHTYQEVLELLRKQVANAQALCQKVEAAGLSMQGCPVTNAGF
jgi:glyoxylase-like metal-dependent hydrolase (beta-lactamase superfamily II)